MGSGRGASQEVLRLPNRPPGLPPTGRALRIGLAPFTAEESAAFLRTIVDAEGCSTQEIDAVSRLCGHLPLALQIAAARLDGRSGWSMTRLVEELSDSDRRLAVLTPDGAGVEAAFMMSYQQLPEPTRTVFRRLAHTTTASFTIATATALTQLGPHDAEQVLEELVDLGLLQPGGPEQYRLDDLIRLFATARLRAEEPPTERTTRGGG
ncbi:hypothetical protein [Micromonospora sp. C95]|uniref:hypothetical protein n=1 Tax=Micromonospora sp. C95 TaxID=2824882 RepID=UPI001B35DFE5|nr:hypothetical protein [Micromonospora sp. C95]MBQ1026119.1 hypothetical protein [Micromonospora sp. C95]